MENENVQNENNEVLDNFKRSNPNIEDSKPITVEEYIELQHIMATLPADRFKAVTDFMRAINQGENFSYREYFKENVASRVATAGRASTAQRNVYADNLEKNEYCNDINYANKSLGIRNVELGEAVDAKTAVARFTKFIDAGEVIQVPLYHSGFWVTIKPPKQKDFIALEQEIGDNHVSLGRETISLIYSNYSVLINRAICNFIARHITEYTVKLPSDKDNIFDYINVQDLNALVLGILSCVHPKGLDYIKACENNVKMEDGSKACNVIIRAKLDPKKLLYVNRHALPDNEMKFILDHMAQRRPDSVSLDSVLEYQKRIKQLAPRTIKVLDGKVEVELENPSLNKYIDVGDRWVGAIIKEAEDVLTEAADIASKNAQIDTLVATMKLGLYNSYIKSISGIDNGKKFTYTDQSTIDAMLDRLSERDDCIVQFLEDITKYISESSIAIVAVPAFECPECKNVEKPEGVTPVASGFENLVPLNLVYLFFDLSASARNRLASASSMF